MALSSGSQPKFIHDLVQGGPWRQRERDDIQDMVKQCIVDHDILAIIAMYT